ncbi:MAG: hypothetical protein JXA51_00955 [Dehalococcoidales bacterium]|nr:hypothetical protein [Dehalococcoidales bacterium]
MSDILEITDFPHELRDTLPETYRLLKKAHLKVHPDVRRIFLHGSRGPAGGYRDDSDLDLCFLTDIDIAVLPGEEFGHRLRMVLLTTLENTECPVELDLAVAFDRSKCGLKCFAVASYEEFRCEKESQGCMGLYKIQKGYDGFVPPITLVSEIFPFLTIWNR